MTVHAYEVNFDGLIGMTHVFGGLSIGNEPLSQYEEDISNPRLAALQGLNKMKFLDSLGIKQAILPPQERPHIATLNKLGFTGTLLDVLKSTKKEASWLLPHISSTAFSKTSNAASVCPSIDSASSQIHFTAANLASQFHRSMEHETTTRVLRAIFPNKVYFEHHRSLPASDLFLDQGAANHIRFCKTYGSPGVQLFTFGKSIKPSSDISPKPGKQPALQTKEASETIARLHRLFPNHSLFAFQNPKAIDDGALLYNQLAIGNQNVLLIHERALWKQKDILWDLKKKVSQICNVELIVIEVSENEIPLQEALKSQFFNSQLITLSDNSMSLICNENVRQFENVNRFIHELTSDNSNPIVSTHFVDLSEALKMGGGPASLSLRVVMNATELAEMNSSILFTDKLYHALTAHINKHYPTTLTIEDLSDPSLYEKSMASLNEISKLLNLNDIYSFQRS